MTTTFRTENSEYLVRDGLCVGVRKDGRPVPLHAAVGQPLVLALKGGLGALPGPGARLVFGRLVTSRVVSVS